MIRSFPARRAGPAIRGWFAVLLLWVGGVGAAQAQVRPDTLRRDTVVVPIPPEQVERDTVPTQPDTVPPDSLVPAPTLPPYTRPLPTGWAAARWEWGRDELARFHGLSLLELVERVPGLAVTRAGGFGRPAGLSALGLGGGRVRVFLDGFELDPLSSATPDLQHIGLADLGSVRVERGLHGLRIELSTFRLEDSRPFSQLEIGAGNHEAKMLRAFLSRPVGARNVVTGAFDLATTQGFGEEEGPFRVTNGRLRWSYLLRPEVGLQAEYRQSSLQRESELEPFTADADRRDVLLRGRARLLPGLTLDGLVGRSWRRAAEEDPLPIDLSTTQAMARAAYDAGFGWVEAASRLRFGDDQAFAAPASDLSLRAALRPLPWLLAEGEARRTNTEGIGGTEVSALARVGPAFGFSAFAEVASGSRALGIYRDSVYEVVDTIDGEEVRETVTDHFFPAVASDAGGLRAGAEWRGWGATLGGAFLTLAPTRAVPFGLAFDRGVAPLEAEETTGFEGYFVLPVPFLNGTLQLDGWYTRFSDVGSRPYLPTEQGRVGLEYHALLVDGQFEPTLRVEGVRRGSAIVPGADGTSFSAASTPYDLLNLFLQIRILDVRAFLLYENLLNNVEAADLVGLPLPGPRILYGVRWHFRN